MENRRDARVVLDAAAASGELRDVNGGHLSLKKESLYQKGKITEWRETEAPVMAQSSCLWKREGKVLRKRAVG